MKGILLAGGTGSRLAPLTKVTNKHLLPIYNKPMVYYPLESMKRAGIDSVLLVSGKGHVGHFVELLGSGKEFGLHINYEIQEEAGGIAQALSLAEAFVQDEAFLVMLGDNIFKDELGPSLQAFAENDKKAHIFLKEVAEPQHYGVPRFEGEQIAEIIEKPSSPPSQYAVTGAYCYTPDVFDVIRGIQPSARGELEISDVNDHYVKQGKLSHSVLESFWGDCGESIDGMVQVARTIQSLES